MSSEQIPAHNPEQIAAQLAKTPNTLQGLTSSPDFLAMCYDRGVNPNTDTAGRPYLQAIADFGSGIVRKHEALGSDPLAVQALGVATAAPVAVYDQLTIPASPDGRRKAFTARANLSRFNGQLREFIDAFPDASIDDVSKLLLNSVNVVVDDPAISLASTDTVRSFMRGALHEKAYGQTLDHTDRWYQPSSLRKDLGGIDYTVEGDNPGVDLSVDVKASRHAIRELGETKKPYAIKATNIGNIVVMHSLVHDSDFRGRITLPTHTAAANAPRLDDLLSRAEDDLSKQSAVGYRSGRA